MKRFAYFEIDENTDAKKAAEVLGEAKKNGYDNILLLHQQGAELTRARYREKLLGVFRAAYRHKIALYVADDSFKHSGTGFGQVSSVWDVWQTNDKGEYEENEEYPFLHYPDLTNEKCAEMVIDCVYKPIMKEFEKFLHYELIGFACVMPLYDSFGKKGNARENLRSAMENGYVKRLKEYCDEQGVEFLLVGGDGSASANFAEKNNILFFDGAYYRGSNLKNVMRAALDGKAVCLAINEGMRKTGEIIERLAGKTAIDAAEPKMCDDGEFILYNMTDTAYSICFLSMEDRCLYNSERDEYYPFGRNTYTFYPQSFLHIVKRTEDMFLDKTPCMVDGVLIGDWEKAGDIPFENDGGKLTFIVPEDTDGEMCICAEGDGKKRIRIGYNESLHLTSCAAVPLFGFMAGMRGEIVTECSDLKLYYCKKCH